MGGLKPEWGSLDRDRGPAVCSGTASGPGEEAVLLAGAWWAPRPFGARRAPGASDAIGNHRVGTRGRLGERYTRLDHVVWCGGEYRGTQHVWDGSRTHQRRQRGELARLHDDRTAHRERGCDLPGPHLDWVVPWDATDTGVSISAERTWGAEGGARRGWEVWTERRGRTSGRRRR